MLHMVLILEDTTIIATSDGTTDWNVEAREEGSPARPQGAYHRGKLNCVQLAAICALSHGIGEEVGAAPETITDLYRIAEEAMKDWPIRLVP